MKYRFIHTSLCFAKVNVFDGNSFFFFQNDHPSLNGWNIGIIRFIAENIDQILAAMLMRRKYFTGVIFVTFVCQDFLHCQMNSMKMYTGLILAKICTPFIIHCGKYLASEAVRYVFYVYHTFKWVIVECIAFCLEKV